MSTILQNRNWKRRMIQLVGIVFPILGLIYFTICGIITWASITPRRSARKETPKDVFPKVEEVKFGTQVGLMLSGYFIPSTGPRAVVLVHGMHSNCWDWHARPLTEALVQAGFHVLVFDLRGHGRSDGERLGFGSLEKQDVRAAVDFLVKAKRVPKDKIGIHGSSYGAATTLLAAPDLPEVGALVADSAFANAGELVEEEIQRGTGTPRWLTHFLCPGIKFSASRFYSLELDAISPENAVRKIRQPLLLIHGTRDSVIPFAHAKRIRQAAGDRAEFWAIDADHTEGVVLESTGNTPSPYQQEYLRKVIDHFDRYLH